ncbi:restriction endonuclease subunit S [Pseudomonas leptonychotis]|uniref:restriction endonuclease subunit S n=1 Tax=Pseudomonas leptonychotis TaxID=2448482 RepID=UPI00386A0F63
MSFPRYPEYKDSGVEWLGKVPGHWHISKLKHFTHFVGGGTPSRDKLEFWNGDIPWVSPKDMKSERINGAEECITEEGLLGSSSSLIAEGRVLMVVRSGILKHTIPVAINDVPVALNQDMKALTFAREKCLSNFFWRWVQGLNDRLLLAWSKPGATVDSIEHDYLAETRIPLPPIDEQLQITLFLESETAKIDGLMAEQEKLIALLKEKRQAVIAHAVTKGLDPKVAMKDSGVEWLGEMPTHWQLKRVKHCVSNFDQGWSPQCESYPIAAEDEWGVLKVGCVNGGIFNPEENKSLPAELDPLPELGIRKGDLLISRANTRELVGSAAVALRDYPNLLLCDKLYRLRLDGAVTSTEFLAYYLSTGQVRGQIELSASGASSSMLNISQATILEMAIALPADEEQMEIVAFIESAQIKINTLIAEAQHAIDLLKERRTALISAAVTGQIDVRGLIKDEQEQAA